MKILRYGKGKGSIDITGPYKSLIEEALKMVAPMTVKIIEKEIDERVSFAKKNWNVRFGFPVTSKKTGKSYIRKEQSKGSINKFKTGIRVLRGGRAIEGFFRNDAPYAYMIEAADYSRRQNGQKSTVPTGQKVSIVTMWKPAEKNVKNLIKKLANAYIAENKRVT